MVSLVLDELDEWHAAHRGTNGETGVKKREKQVTKEEKGEAAWETRVWPKPNPPKKSHPHANQAQLPRTGHTRTHTLLNHKSVKRNGE